MTGRNAHERAGAGAGARGVSSATALVHEHATLCGLVARACVVLRLDWGKAQGETETERRMAAFRAWLDVQAGARE